VGQQREYQFLRRTLRVRECVGGCGACGSMQQDAIKRWRAREWCSRSAAALKYGFPGLTWDAAGCKTSLYARWRWV